VIYLLGETRDELAGSAWAETVHDHLGGRPPVVDFDHEKRLAEVLVRGSRRGALSSGHDLADGGLAQALVESCLRHGHGARITLPKGLDPFVALFSESSGRVLVSTNPDAEDDLIALCREAGVPRQRLGTVGDAADAELEVTGQFMLPLTELREAWSRPLREAFAH
jgi:phosphoribosylformylglycinamidine synthase